MATFGNINNYGPNTTVYAPQPGTKSVTKYVLDRQGVVDHVLFKYAGGATPGNVKAVIYDNTGSGGLPGALVATSSLVVSPTAPGLVAFPFPSAPTLNAGTYWVGLLATTNGLANCWSLANGLAYNSDTIGAGPSNPFGASPSLLSYQYPELVFYTPVLAAGTYYGKLLGGDDLSGNYAANDILCQKVTITVGGTISKLTTFVNDVYASAKGKGVIYDASGSGGAPGNLIGATNELVGFALNGNDLTFASPVSVAAADYWIGLMNDTTMNISRLADSTPTARIGRTYTSGPPSTFGASPTLSTGSWPLWATFAAAPLVPKQPQIIVCT